MWKTFPPPYHTYTHYKVCNPLCQQSSTRLVSSTLWQQKQQSLTASGTSRTLLDESHVPSVAQ